MLLCFLIGFLLLSCIGCQEKDSPELDLTKTYQKEQGFCYPGLSWGLSLEAAEQAVGIDFGNAYAGTESEGFDYRNSKEYKNAVFRPSSEEVFWNGMKGDVVYQFKNGRLWAAGILFDTFSSPQAESDLDKLVAELNEVYGQEAVVRENSEPAAPREFRWESTNDKGETTAAVLSAVLSKDQITSISLDFCHFPNNY